MMWIVFGVLFAMTKCELQGDNICLQEERYVVNVTKIVPKNITVREYIWCMNVPPRCSSYSMKTVNHLQVMAENHTRIVKKCCPGFTEIDDACVTQCDACKNGICNDENKCLCRSGYYGDNCDKTCTRQKWGPYCRHQCFCEQGNCDPSTGVCICPPGYTGIRCEIDEKSLTTQTTETITQTPTRVENVAFETIPDFNFTTTVKHTTITEFTLQPRLRVDINSPAKRKSVNTSSDNKEENSVNSVPSPLESSVLFLAVCSISIATLLLFLVGCGYVMARKLKRNNNNWKQDGMLEDNSGKNPDHSTVSVFTKSIFHTPLPDPPTFGNPTFNSPNVEKSNDSSFQAHVVCSINFPNKNNNKSKGELFYDHPPSTGSYRAASSLGVPDFELKSEPLYDEIPCWKFPASIGAPPSYKTDNESTNLYINTTNNT